MEKIREELKDKITSVKEFEITENGLISEIKKEKKLDITRSGWNSNLWWKRFRLAQKVLKKSFESEKSEMITD